MVGNFFAHHHVPAPPQKVEGTAMWRQEKSQQEKRHLAIITITTHFTCRRILFFNDCHRPATAIHYVLQWVSTATAKKHRHQCQSRWAVFKVSPCLLRFLQWEIEIIVLINNPHAPAKYIDTKMYFVDELSDFAQKRRNSQTMPERVE